MPLSPKTYTFLCGSFAALGAALFGYDLAVIASVLVAPDFIKVTGLDDPDRDANYLGFIVSSMLLGAFAGSIPASLIADKFSRRTSIVIAGVIFLLGGSLQTGANSKGMMLAGRFFAGWSIGSLGVLAPLYQSEIAHPSFRGRLMATFQFSLGVGAVVAGWIAYGCAKGFPDSPIRWRLPLAFQMLPAIPLVGLTFLMPESPRWLMIRGREHDALQTLARLHANGDTNDEFVQSEFREMQSKVQHETETQNGWKERNNIRKVMMGVILQFATQMTGVSAIQYYSPTVYKAVGFSTNTTLLIQSINNINGLFGEACCIFFLDRLGRRWPLVYGNIASGCTFAVASALAHRFVVGKGSHGQGVAFVIMTFIYNFVFSACIGPLSWVYPAEIMNTAIRAKATALTAMASWIANFMIGQVSPKAFAQIGWRYYLVFTVCSFTNALVFFLFYPETAGRTLEAMDEYFENNSWIVIFGNDTRQVLSSAERTRITAMGMETFSNVDNSKAVSGHFEEKA